MKFCIMKDDWNTLGLILDSLKVVKTATVQAQKSDLTLSDFYKIWNTCKFELENLSKKQKFSYMQTKTEFPVLVFKTTIFKLLKN
jgi:hypothetical protein